MYWMLIALGAALCGCGSTQAYPGPELPEEEVALVKGYSTFCSGSVRLHKLDGRYSGTRLSVRAGRHAAELFVTSEPYIPSDSPGPQFAQCVSISRHAVSFPVRAGHTYWFSIDETDPRRPRVSLWESISPQGPEGRRVNLEVQQRALERACYLDGRFTRCFPGHY